MDTNIQIPKKEIAPGIFTTGGVATVPVNNPITGQANVITTQSLQPAQPIPILPQPPVDTGTGASAVAGAETQANDFQTNYQNYLNNINQQTPEKMSFDNLLKEFTTASENTLGQGQIQLQAEQQAGLPAKYQERAGVQGQIKTGIAEYNRLKAEYDAQKANIEAGAGRKGLTTGAVMGQQGAVQRAAESALNAKAADIQILQAQDQALAGDIEAAQNTVNRAVDLMYKDREAVLALKRDQLNIAKEFLSDADKKRAEARDYAYKKEEQKIAEEKANAKTIENMLLEATPNAPANVIANAKAIKDKGGSALEVAQALGKYGGDYLKTELLKAQIETEKAQRSNYLASANKTNAEANLLKGDTSNVSNPQYAGIINTIIGSGKFTKDQTKAITNAINNGEDPLTVIKNQAKNILGQTEGTKITNFEVAKSAMGDLSSALNQFYANGGNTNLLSGNYEKVINKLGTVSDPKLVDLAVQIQSQLQIYRNAVSGTAYSVQEGKDIASIFPGINKTQGLNQAIIKGRLSAFDSVIDGSYRTALGNSYDSLKNLEKTPTQQTDNKFSQSLPGGMSKIPGTTIINKVNPDGSLNFILPTNQPTR